MQLEPVERRSLSDEVYDQLKQRIVSGGIAPGDALPSERMLAEALGVNRGALREALKRLQQAHLVSIQHGGATRVRDFRREGSLELLGELIVSSTGEVRVDVARSIVEMRSAIAPDAARLAALRATGDQQARLVSLAEDLAAAAERDERQTIAMRFWSEVIEASGNIAYRLAHNTLRSTYDRIRQVLSGVLADELDDRAAYRRIARAISHQDAAKARSEAARLVRRGAMRLLALLDSIESREAPR